MFTKLFFFPSLHCSARGWAFASIFALTVPVSAPSQDTLFFDQNFSPVKDRAVARFMEVRHCEPTDTGRCVVLTYLANGNLVTALRYSNYAAGEQDGHSIYWFESGQLCSDKTFVNGKQQGQEKNYYRNGQLQSQITWNEDTIVSGAFFHEDGSPNTEVRDEDWLGTAVIVQPSFPGGNKSLREYLAEAARYPEESLAWREEGVVTAAFLVEKNGVISNVKITKSLSPPLDQQAKKVINGMPNWVRGTVNGVPDRMKVLFPIRFMIKKSPGKS